MEQKKTKSKLKDKNLNKSISLIIKTDNFSNPAKQKKLNQFIPKTSYSVQTSDRKPKQHFGNSTTNNTNYLSGLYSLNLYRQNSQGSLCSLKKDNQSHHFSETNYRHPKLNMYLLSEIKSPKIIDYINNRRKKQNNNNSVHNINERCYENKNIHNDSNYYKKPSQNSFSFVKRNRNLSQRNINVKLKLEEYYDNSIIKTNKNCKNNSRIKLKNEEPYINKKSSANNNRYDKNKCVIERKFYGEDKLHKEKNNNKTKGKDKDKEKYKSNKTLSGIGENEYNKLFYNHSKNNMQKELTKTGNGFNNNCNNNILNNDLHKKQKNNKNLSINNLINYKWSSTKMLLNKSKTNNNILNTYSENQSKSNNNNFNFNYNNDTKENKESKNGRYNDIKLIFPAFFNKMDNNNESSQESTNLVGNTFSNKITINNSNIGTRKEKFINSFLDGPEDIHCRFVDLHHQRKIFYENMCNKANEIEGNLNNNIAKISDFDKSEYSEYFENFNEDVPII